MTPEFRRFALVVAVLGLLVALFVALRSNDDTTATTTTTAVTTAPATTEAMTTGAATTAERVGPAQIRLVVVGGKPKGGIQRPTVELGAEAVIVVRSDVADEIHLHGYDLSAEVAAGGTARMPFTADIPGRFELELEGTGVEVAELTVTP